MNKARGRLKSGFSISGRARTTQRWPVWGHLRVRRYLVPGLLTPHWATTLRLAAEMAALTLNKEPHMAGTSLGAASPTSSPATSRTRTCHGFFTVGSVPAMVFSTRRQADPAVVVDLGHAGTMASGRMSPVQARAAARALLQAAEAVEVAERRPGFTRGGAA